MQQNLIPYHASYSESGLWNKLPRFALKAGRTLVENVLILWYTLPNASTSDRAVIIGTLGYFISPVDAIPDFIPGGFGDDALIVAAAVAKVRLSASPDVIARAKLKAAEIFGEAEHIDER